MESSSDIETGEECEGSKKSFWTYIEKNTKEETGLMQNPTKGLSRKESRFLALCCLVGKFQGKKYCPLWSRTELGFT